MLNHPVIVDTFGVPATTQQALIYLMPVMMNKEPQIEGNAAGEKDNPRRLIVNFIGQHQLFQLKK